jgi:hypothetical protein
VHERFVPRAGDHPALNGIEPSTLPALGGYVVASAKPTALPILDSHLGDPVLLSWRAGLGRVAVFTSDLTSPGSAAFRRWRDASRLWTQTIRWLGRDAGGGALDATLRDGGRGPRLEVEARQADGSPLDLDAVTALVATPDGAELAVTAEATAPGRFEATIAAAGEGPYVVAVTGRGRGSREEHRVVRALHWRADRERARLGVDLPFLARLASLTGGRVLAGGETPFDGPRPRAWRDVTAWAIGIALALFLLDITTAGTRGLTMWRTRRRGAGARPAAA